MPPVFSGVPNKGEQNQNWLPQPCLLGGPLVGGSATSPLHFRGCPTKGNKIGIGCLRHAFLGAQKWAEVPHGPQATHVPAPPPQCAHSASMSSRVSPSQNWLPQPCLLGSSKPGRSAMSPLNSRGSATKGNKIRIGCLCHAFSGAEKWAEVLPHPCILGGRQKSGTKSELAASATPSQGPKRGRKCYVTPAFWGVPNKGEQKQNWLPRPCLLRGPKVGGSATSPLHSRGPQQRGAKSELAASAMPSWGPKSERKCYVTFAFLGVLNKVEPNQNWLLQVCLLGNPKVGGSATSPLCSRRSPTKGNKIIIGWLSHAFSGAQKWAELLCHPCILGVPQ